MDSLALNDMTLILGVDMNINVSIETHVTYDKPFILYIYIYIYMLKEEVLLPLKQRKKNYIKRLLH
jgi:hypothetical protein